MHSVFCMAHTCGCDSYGVEVEGRRSVDEPRCYIVAFQEEITGSNLGISVDV